MADAKEITILDQTFTITMPYDAGHTCTEAEAKVLNQTRRENIGNNFRKRVQALIDGEEGVTLEGLQEEFAKIDAEYVFTLATAAAAQKFTPVEREARKIAREYIKQELDKQGQKIGTPAEGFTEAEWDDALEAQIAEIAANPEVVKIAEGTVKAREKSSKLELGGLSIGKAAA